MSNNTIPAPSPWVSRFAALVEPGGSVLDLACGSGRHARLFLERGHTVTALDRDLSGFNATAAGLERIEADLEDGSPWPLLGRRFAGVIVTNYLFRPLLPRIVESVAAGGILIYETFALGNEAFGRPKNPDFLLEPEELIRAVEGELTVIAYEHGITDRPAAIQRLCAGRGTEARRLP